MTTNIIGIDPGPERSAVVCFAGYSRTVRIKYADNALIRSELSRLFWTQNATLAIEQVKCYGKAVGDSVLLTAMWCGAFWSYVDRPAYLIPRQTIGSILCESARAAKPEVRQALIDRFGGNGAIGTKKDGKGPLYDVKGHAWDALAVAVAWRDLNERGELDRCYRVPR